MGGRGGSGRTSNRKEPPKSLEFRAKVPKSTELSIKRLQEQAASLSREAETLTRNPKPETLNPKP